VSSVNSDEDESIQFHQLQLSDGRILKFEVTEIEEEEEEEEEKQEQEKQMDERQWMDWNRPHHSTNELTNGQLTTATE